MKRLVLFDIDGTILNGGALWRECFEGAMAACFPGMKWPRISFSGKTDRQICREFFEAMGVAPDRIDTDTDRVLDAYLSRADECLRHRAAEVAELPGVRRLLESLSGTSEVVLGLLTGNVERGAKLKLQALAMDQYFLFGAYGDDHWDRYELPAIAARRAQEVCGKRFSGKEIVIIGDTPHDVNCGKSIGVRAIAVGTNSSIKKEALHAAEPDAYFDDLSDTASVERVIFADL